MFPRPTADPAAARINPSFELKPPLLSDLLILVLINNIAPFVFLHNYYVLYQNQPIDMPPKELELLYFLASHPNQVFTREQLLDHIWGYDYVGDTRTVDVHIKRLREKFQDHETWGIGTVWGIGYKFEVRK